MTDAPKPYVGAQATPFPMAVDGYTRLVHRAIGQMVFRLTEMRSSKNRALKKRFVVDCLKLCGSIDRANERVQFAALAEYADWRAEPIPITSDTELEDVSSDDDDEAPPPPPTVRVRIGMTKSSRARFA